MGLWLQTCVRVRYRAILWVGGCRHVLGLDIELYCGSVVVDMYYG